MLLTCLEAKVAGLWRKRICHRCRPRRGSANTAMACDDDSMTFLPRDRRIGSSKKHCHTFMRHFTGGQVICRYLLSPILLSCKANSACQSIKDKADHEITCYDDRVEDLPGENIMPQDIVELKANKAPVDIVTSQGWKVEMFSVLSILSVALLSPIYWLKPIS